MAKTRTKLRSRAPRKKMGRPRLSDAVRQRRGTLEQHRRRETKPKRVRAAKIAAPTPQDYVTVARRYAADVLSGRIVAGQWVKLACERQDRDVMRAADEPRTAYVWRRARD